MATDSDDSLGEASACELQQYYRSGQASPVDATRVALARIERFNPAVNAYTYVDTEGAMAAAHASARRWGQGQALSAVDGLPVSIKDLTEVRGMPAREGSATTGDALCDQDSPPAARLREAGAVLLGKTNTPEFGWKATTDNPLFGITRNPWNTSRTPGGSSGGAGAAAALNMGVLHQGGDSGGSIRIPAAFTGVFGIKPTFGWVPQWPPSKMASLSQIGPLTRSVDDAVQMLNIMGRYTYRDPYALRGQPDDWGEGLVQGLDGFRVAYSPDLKHVAVEPEIAQRVAEAVEVFSALGAEVEQIDNVFDNPVEIFRALWFIGSLELESQMSAAQREQMDPGLREFARRGEPYSGLDLFRAQQERAKLTLALEHFFQDYDVLLTPSIPIPPFAAGHDVPPDSDMTDWMQWAPLSYPFNLGGQPCASVPCGFTESGLPIGLQIVAGKFDDTKVLRAAEAYMAQCPPRFPERPNERSGPDANSEPDSPEG